MSLEKLIGKKFNAEIIEESGAFGGTLKIKEELLDFVIGKIENNKITYFSGIKPGKNKLVVKQIDISGDYRMLFAEVDSALDVQKISNEVKDFLVDSTKIKSFEDFTSKYLELDNILISAKPANEREEDLLNRFRSRYAIAKGVMTQRWAEESLLEKYSSGVFRIATLTDLPQIELLSKRFYDEILVDPTGTADVSEITREAKQEITRYHMQEQNGEVLGVLGYTVLHAPSKEIPYAGVIGVKDPKPGVAKEFLYKAMRHLNCQGFFREIYPEIEDLNFYRQTGFRQIKKYKEYCKQLKKEVNKILIYLDPKK